MEDEPVNNSARRRIMLTAVVLAAILAALAWAALDLDRDADPVASAPTTFLPEPTRSTEPDPGGSDPGGSDTAQPTPIWEGPTVPPIEEKLAQGSASAPVTIVEFGDFKCVNCGQFAREIEPELRRRYIDTGQVRLFWRDFPAQGRESKRAAIAGRAAARQDKFWAFHDALYADQSGSLTDERLRAVAAKVGLDMARFDADRRDPALRDAVEQDFAFAVQLGMPGTPAFLINGEFFFGAQSLSTFVKQIEKARDE